MARYDFSWLTPDVAAARAHHYDRLAALYRGEMTGPLYLAGEFYGKSHGLWGTNEIDMLAEPAAWLDEVLADMAERGPAKAASRSTFYPLGIEPDPLGVHYIDALFGAHVYIYEQQTWGTELSYDLAELEMPDLARSAVFQRSLRLVQMAVEAVAGAGGQLYVTTPVLSCASNIAINLFEQRFLEALVMRPDVARRALCIINDVITACTRAFYDLIPPAIRRCTVACSRYAPAGFGFIDGCATQLVSGKQYREFLADLDMAVLDRSPYGGQIHLCGSHKQHISTWRTLSKLRSVQLNDRATEDFRLYFDGLRDDQILYIAPTERTSAQVVIDYTGGRRLILQCSAPAAG